MTPLHREQVASSLDRELSQHGRDTASGRQYAALQLAPSRLVRLRLASKSFSTVAEREQAGLHERRVQRVALEASAATCRYLSSFALGPSLTILRGAIRGYPYGCGPLVDSRIHRAVLQELDRRVGRARGDRRVAEALMRSVYDAEQLRQPSTRVFTPPRLGGPVDDREERVGVLELGRHHLQLLSPGNPDVAALGQSRRTGCRRVTNSRHEACRVPIAFVACAGSNSSLETSRITVVGVVGRVGDSRALGRWRLRDAEPRRLRGESIGQGSPDPRRLTPGAVARRGRRLCGRLAGLTAASTVRPSAAKREPGDSASMAR